MIQALLGRKLGMTRIFDENGVVTASTLVEAGPCFITQLRTQETDGYTARQHLETVKRYAPEIAFDYVILNDRPISQEQAVLYAADGAYQIGMQDHLFEKTFGMETRIVRADLLDEGEKVRHNPEKLARVVAACCEEARARQAAVQF